MARDGSEKEKGRSIEKKKPHCNREIESKNKRKAKKGKERGHQFDCVVICSDGVVVSVCVRVYF